STEARTRLVASWYQTYLGRGPVNGEEQYWVGVLGSGKGQEEVLTNILGSQEYYNRAAAQHPGTDANATFVTSLFQQFLNRAPSSTELANFTQNVLPSAGRPGVAWIFVRSEEYRGR